MEPLKQMQTGSGALETNVEGVWGPKSQEGDDSGIEFRWIRFSLEWPCFGFVADAHLPSIFALPQRRARPCTGARQTRLLPRIPLQTTARGEGLEQPVTSEERDKGGWEGGGHDWNSSSEPPNPREEGEPMPS